jgi:hypothetical protein
MLEELHRRNFAATTIRTYLHGVEHFSRYFRRPPDQLGPEDIRKYQAMLFTKLKYSLNTVILRLASLRFFYIHVLKRGWSIAETPYPKKVRCRTGGRCTNCRKCWRLFQHLILSCAVDTRSWWRRSQATKISAA